MYFEHQLEFWEYVKVVILAWTHSAGCNLCRLSLLYATTGLCGALYLQ